MSELFESLGKILNPKNTNFSEDPNDWDYWFEEYIEEQKKLIDLELKEDIEYNCIDLNNKIT